MKKIQVTTVEQTAQVQVILLNSYLIAKSVRAMLLLKHVLAGTRVKEKGADKDSKPIYTDKLCRFNEDDIDTLHDEVLPFLEELCNAFEEAE